RDQHALHRPDAIAKLDPLARWRVGIQILVVERQLADLDVLEVQRVRCKLDERVGHLAGIRALAKTPDNESDVASHEFLRGGAVHAPGQGSRARARNYSSTPPVGRPASGAAAGSGSVASGSTGRASPSGAVGT